MGGCAALLDIKSTCDRVDHILLWSMLYNRGIQGNLLEVLKLPFNNCLRVGLSSFHSEILSPKVGLLQGSVLIPSPFNVYIDSLLPQFHHEGVGLDILGAGHINTLLFADDVALLAESTSAMRQLLKIAEEYAGLLRLTWHVSKSVILTNRHMSRLVLPVQIYSQGLPSSIWTNTLELQ